MEQQQTGPDRKAIIAILLSAIVWAVWMQTSYTRTQEAREQAARNATPVATATADGTAAGAGTAGATGDLVTGTAGAVAATTPPPPPATTARLDNEVLSLELSSVGARPIAADLKEYREAENGVPTDSFVHLVTAGAIQGSDDIYPLRPWFGDAASSRIPAGARFEQVSATDEEVVYRWTGPDGLTLTRTFRTSENGYLLTMTEQIENAGSQPITGRPGVVWATNLKGVKTSWFVPGEQEFSASYSVNDAVVSETPDADEDVVSGGAIEWVGIEDRYFLAAVIPTEPGIEARDAARLFRPGSKSVAALALAPELTLEPGGSRVLQYKLFLGPKDFGLLRDVGYNLDESVAWGRFLSPIAKALWFSLHWLHSLVGNWGLAIILLTVIVRGALSPLTGRQMRISNEFATKTAKMKPHLDRLREKHKDDPMKLNQETWALYKQYGASPLAPMMGCLPLLLQMPIWFALYRVLWTSIDLRHAPFALWLQDLSAPDPWKILPLLLGAVTWVQMRLTPTTGMDPAQARMMQWMMPLMFTVPMMGLPAGLVLYIFTSTLMNIGQQWYYRRKMPRVEVPVTTVQGTAKEVS